MTPSFAEEEESRTVMVHSGAGLPEYVTVDAGKDYWRKAIGRLRMSKANLPQEV